ncbi:cysteine peptidase family C39 domain-containing protein [Rubripirellula reticaptiva]|uniref:Peptidase C39 family protein n=1 Tax=Rubripirellula reticaptiva TaxID=2528013 RepID=A0A5C6EIH8_9BACT|nr:peptidase C39 [Rubripirellula reticaptiva]TWU48255.1 hypothetical protein Poly59_51010 [Rubripirellula reticaptiva]
MSADLAFGIFAITGLSALAYTVGRRVGLNSGKARQPYFLASMLAGLVFSWEMAGKLSWAVVFPTSSVLFWANLMPVILSFAAGIACTMVSLTGWRRQGTVIGLMLLTIGYTLTPIARPIFARAETDEIATWRDNVCLQSHSATCAPAAAATLLSLSGISATEFAMVSPCLTSSMGTEPLGLFRGLAIAASGKPVRPAVASSDPATWTEGDQLPNIALVEFELADSQGSSGRIFGPQHEGHAVVIHGRDPRGNWIVLDPAFGRTVWSPSTFESRFTGDAIYMKSVSK